MLLMSVEEAKDKSEMRYQWEARERHVWLFHTVEMSKSWEYSSKRNLVGGPNRDALEIERRLTLLG